MHIILYVVALAAIAGALGLSWLGLDSELATIGPEALAAALRDHGLLLVGGLVLAGLGRILQHMRSIDVGLRRVAKAAEDAASLDG
jgi:hypothetical protein